LTQVAISFTQGYDGGLPITNYEYSLGGAAFSTITPADTVSPVTIPGLINQSTYAVTLRAINAAGNGTSSSNFSARTADIPPAPIPYSTIAGNGSITVLYTQPSDGGSPITNYQYSSNAGATFTAFSPATSNVSSATITGLSNTSTYGVALKAVNQFGASATYSTISGVTFYPPSKPINLTPTPGNSNVSIAFRQNSDGGTPITNYKYSLNSTIYTAFPGAGFTSSPVILSNLTNQSSYTVSLKATNLVGDSVASDVIIAYTASVPPAPTSLSTVSVTNTSITASFTQSTQTH
jgi:titin